MTETTPTTPTPHWTAWLRRHGRTDWERVGEADSDAAAHRLLAGHLDRIGMRVEATAVCGPGVGPPSGSQGRQRRP